MYRILRSLETLKEKFYEYIHIPLKPICYLLNKINEVFKLKLDVYVIGSEISSSLDRYFLNASRYILLTVVLSIAIFLYIALTNGIPLPYSLLLSTIISFLFILPLSLALIIAIPRILYSNRGAIIDSKAIILLTAVAFLITSGQSIYNIFEDISKVLGKDYKYFSLEFDLVKSFVKIGIPLDEALRRVAEITPSRSISELLISLASISNIGGDVFSSIKMLLDRYIARYEISIGRAVEILNIYMEIYVALALLIPVLIGSISALTIFHPVAGISFEYLMFLSSFILLPISTLIIIVLADVIVSRLKP